MATTTKPAAKRAMAPTVADYGRAFGELARVVGNYRADLAAIAAGDRGPIPAEMVADLRGMIANTGDEFLNLTGHLAGE